MSTRVFAFLIPLGLALGTACGTEFSVFDGSGGSGGAASSGTTSSDTTGGGASSTASGGPATGSGTGTSSSATGGCSPDDANDCTTDTCDGNQPVHTPVDVGTLCAGGTMVCDGQGHCVQCNVSGDCPFPEQCVEHACAGDPCQDGVQDGSETDVDCGGLCPPCNVGQFCFSGFDCATGLCDFNVCVTHICGNSALEAEEYCDDGNNIDGDGCDSNCTATTCGNGIQSLGEECDDGNNNDGDGCSANCQVET